MPWFDLAVVVLVLVAVDVGPGCEECDAVGVGMAVVVVRVAFWSLLCLCNVMQFVRCAFFELKLEVY